MARKLLTGEVVVITRPEDQGREFATRLRKLGARVLIKPAIAIRPTGFARLKKELRRLERYDWLMFTSQNGVRIFRQCWGRALLPKGTRVAAVGAATAGALKGLRVDLVADEFTTRSLGTAMMRRARKGERVLYPCADEHNRQMIRALRVKGVAVREVVVYRIRPKRINRAGLAGATIVTFASALSAQFFLASNARYIRGCKIVCIGPVTAQRVRAMSHRVHAVARRHDVKGLVAAVLACRRTNH